MVQYIKYRFHDRLTLNEQLMNSNAYFNAHIGGRGHIPRWIGKGVMLQSTAFFLFSMPHFLSTGYTYTVYVSMFKFLSETEKLVLLF